MEFRIADTFSDSLARLSNEEQKAVKTTAFDLQMNPESPGLQFHRIERARDSRFWSVRVSRDLRVIVHRTNNSLLLCYVDHHDDAYRWAQNRKLETHPRTGAAQLVEIRERVKEITIPAYVVEEQPVRLPVRVFENQTGDELLNYGVPEEWLEDVLQATEDSLLDIAEHLPAEAAEALLELATGGTPQIQFPAGATDPFNHPDALRRFRVMDNVEELEQALDYPWEKWTIFLHPEQRKVVEYAFSGPARVSGSAGTGKTVVALHRAVYLARTHPHARVLLTTFSDALANALTIKLRRLIAHTPRLGERIEVYALDSVSERLYGLTFGKPAIASPAETDALLQEASERVGEHGFSDRFLAAEWSYVVDAWQLDTWEAYRDVLRLGRKIRLPESRRKVLWSIFEKVREGLAERNLITLAGMFHALEDHYQKAAQAPYNFIVVDESQDLSVAQLRFLAALAGDDEQGLFFAGDLGQRIFQQPFSWKSLGVDIRGRSRALRINYRTSHQIRMQADRLLGPEIADVDGITEERKGTISVFNGPRPGIKIYGSKGEERAGVVTWLQEQLKEGINPEEIGVFVRSEAELDRAVNALDDADLPYIILDENIEIRADHASVSTMHLAKGLEFRAVAVMACDDEVIPSMARIETAADEVDLEEVYNTERHLLYVACTRARDHLLVTGVKPGSEFLEDMAVMK